MAIQLRTLNRDNLHECIGLSVGDDQKNFVATNEEGEIVAQFQPES